MPIGTQDFEYVLDNEFFKNIEGEDVQKGKVKVKLTVKRTAASFELDFDLELFKFRAIAVWTIWTMR